MSKNPVHHKRTKHIELDIHFVREKVAVGDIRVLHVPSARRFADVFTKGLPKSLFNDFRDSLCVSNAAAETTGGGGGLLSGPTLLARVRAPRMPRSAPVALHTHTTAPQLPGSGRVALRMPRAARRTLCANGHAAPLPRDSLAGTTLRSASA
jgi:hypothetical protein